jgi:hypothetical protein
MSRLELEVATVAVRELQGYGVAELQYITAGFEPYTSAQRPDVLFYPNSGSNTGQPFFVELRMPVSAGHRLPTPETLQERRDFIETDPPNHLFFALATSRKIDEAVRSAFSAKGIEILDNIESGEDLARRILKWATLPQYLLQI